MDQEQVAPTFQSFPTNNYPRNNNKISPTIVVGAIILVLVIGTFLIIGQTKKTKEATITPTITTTESKLPSPTLKPVIDKKTVKIQVINGTGTPGQAGAVVKELETDGYITSNIKTGNAEEFNNTVTTIESKESHSDVAINIKKTLSTTFDDIKIQTSYLEDDNEYDIVIVTGGKIYVTPTSQVSPTSVTPSPTSEVTSTPTPTLTLTPSPTSTR